MLDAGADHPVVAPVPPASSRGDARRPIDVEQLLHWAYQTQAVATVEHRGSLIDGGRGGGSSMGRLGEAGGGGRFGVRLAPDAEAVHDAVLRLPPARRAIVIEHARSGTRPDARLSLRPRFEFVANGLDRKGRPKPKIEYDWAGKRALYCPIVERDFDVAADRDRWSEWWLGLVELRAALAPRLVSWRVTGPAVAESPWQKLNAIDTLETTRA